MTKCKAFAIAAVISLFAAPALGDWMPGDTYKMHFPQLPDVNGWDVYVEDPMILADDWRCSETGLVDDIHFWGSWKDDVIGNINSILVRIYSDDRSGPFSKPGDVLWEHVFYKNQCDYTVQFWGTGDQGWYDPKSGTVIEHDHNEIYQINITDIDEKVGAFIQEEDDIYWLALRVNVDECHFGWKTADVDSYPAPYTGNHFEDDAVWSNCPPPPEPPNWAELNDPITLDSLDLAFVITPEPSTWIMLAIGVLAMPCLLRQRRLPRK